MQDRYRLADHQPFSEMAEVLDVSSNDDGSRGVRKRGKYLPEEDLIIVREVAALRAHVAGYGNVKQSFESVAQRVNQNPHMMQKVNWKAVQDRYKRLQEDFDADDRRNSSLSGIAGGEMGELYQALSQMREERDTFLTEKKADKNEKTKREEEKEIMGRRVVEMALCRKSKRSISGDESESSSSGGSSGGGNVGGNSARKRRKTRQTGIADVSGELEMFGAQLKEADLARIQLEVDQLSFQKEKYAKELEEREKEREERRKEREDGQKLELEKFKIMFDMLREKMG